MLKIIAIITKFILVTLTALLFGSCIKYETNETVEGSGNVTNEIRNIEKDFNKIEVNNAINLVVEQSDKIEVTVIADEFFQKDISTEVKNGTLIVSNRSNKNSFSLFGFKRNYIQNIKVKKVIVKLPKIESLEANSASKIENNGIIKSEDITLKSSSAATMNLNLESDKIKAQSSSASTINLEGMALEIDVSSSSGSSINAEKLLVNDVFANSSSGSSISIHPIVQLKANASSGSSIKYNITPKTIEKESSSGGSINKI